MAVWPLSVWYMTIWFSMGLVLCGKDNKKIVPNQGTDLKNCLLLLFWIFERTVMHKRK
jgi:hypothetical protein